MGGRFLAASFYAPRPVEQDVFLDALGVVGEQWGPLPRVFTHVQALSDHTCATLRFSQNAFLELRTAHEPDDAVPLAQDAGLPFARFFRAAAVRAGCEVAFLVTHPHQSDGDWLDLRYWMMIARDADSLAAERFGLLYLDDDMVFDWDAPRLDGRSVLPGGPGLTFFAGTGWARWYGAAGRPSIHFRREQHAALRSECPGAEGADARLPDPAGSAA